jgi:hypothetical protein
MRGRKFAFGAATVLTSPSILVIGPAAMGAGASSSTSQSLCIGHHPQEYVWYSGHERSVDLAVQDDRASVLG